MKKRIIALLTAVLLLMLAAVPALAAAPEIRETEYKGNGVVDVEFSGHKVTYKNLKVTVKDAKGNKLTATVTEKDNDEIRFKVDGLKSNSTYRFTISGVRAGKKGSYGKVKGTFTTPSASKPQIREVEYDAADRELGIEFATKVEFHALKVTVENAAGQKLNILKIKKGSDEVELTLEGMERGQTYTITVSGVRIKGKGKYRTLKTTFTP